MQCGPDTLFGEVCLSHMTTPSQKFVMRNYTQHAAVTGWFASGAG